MKRSTSLFAAVLGAAVIGLLGLSSCAKSSNEKPAEEQAPSQEMGLCSVELFDVAELLPIFEAIDESTIGMERQLGEMLSGIGEMNSPAVGRAFYNDTAAINAILNGEKAQALLPSDIAFSWEPYNDRGSFYVLVAWKK